ncbi:cysteine-rich receptor-like protein kinase 8, partial [Tanacetum coccineum]
MSFESVMGSVLAKGSPGKEFKDQKGLCQVDPLSPFLFIIAVEALHVTIQEAKSKNLFVGAKMGLNKIDISHLQFADDALIIGNFPKDLRSLISWADTASDLTSLSNIRYGFYNLSVGQIPDQVNTIALCRGDIQPNACRSCINTASAALREECPYQKAAIGWYEECWVRYTNVTILGTLDTRIARCERSKWKNGCQMLSQFNQALDQLLDQLRSEASRGGSLRKYASNSTNGPDFTTIYGFMQCTPDLSENQCYNCLDLAIQYIPTCCDSKRGARIFYPNCYIRYEVYRFLSATVDIALPSPPQPPSFESSPPPPPPPP